MRRQGRVHRFWLWTMEVRRPRWLVDHGGVETCWRYGYCVFVGHAPMEDQCGRPSHRFCGVCMKPTPHAPVVSP